MDQNNNSTAPKGWKKKLIIVLVVLVILLGGVFLWRQFVHEQTLKFMATLKSPTVSVSTIPAKKAQWHLFVPAVGSTIASKGVNVNAEVDGNVVAIDFKSGDVVKKGQAILQLNPSILQAQLANNRASLYYAKVSYQRQQQLVRTDAASRSALDRAKASYQEALAQVNQTKALLEQKTIRAPFTGLLGIRQVDIGEHLTAGKTIVNLQALQPMFVDFDLSENVINKLRLGYQVEVSTVAYPNKIFNGKVIAINSALSNNTRSLQVRAQVDNSRNMLLPGMFANVRLMLPKVETVIEVPQIAVNFSPSGDFVYVIENNVAKRVYVTVGERRGTMVAITKGLQAGENIVYAGQVKLRNNTKVVVENK